MEADWDLHAVVRGCNASSTFSSGGATTTVSAATTTNSSGCFKADFGTQSCISSFGSEQVGDFFSLLTDPFEARVSVGDLQELYKPFFPKYESLHSPPESMPVSCFSSLSVSNEQIQFKQQQQRPKQSRPGSVNTSANSHTSRSKKRKNQFKKICQVPAEALSSDIWAWRKYGQKPIKGSPYPRGYYRCSSSKGCMARKQVERNKSDPTMFIVTYTAEHNHPAPTHRNSLAGSTRQKTSTPQTVTNSDSNNNNKPSPAKPTCSSPATSLEDEFLPQITNTSDSREEKDVMDDGDDGDDVDDEFGGFSDLSLTDDFFAGLEEFTLPVSGDRFSGRLTSSLDNPWLVNNATTAAGGF
ncbi:hypothetical protein K2173_013363 [Erythroxylum novogranatense]|uniref:WRKY domain-containing protein n=1 Tax=Erythroxylum novogranatense TaxID=1862640 RepID=A0AAV8S9P3_9ROSI|nr:hypothetical protein K2173_013363 [Erythroxylum novogranatense]